ncbi:hypothetical protein D3C80_2046990 [compost metagenome]
MPTKCMRIIPRPISTALSRKCCARIWLRSRLRMVTQATARAMSSERMVRETS